MITDAEKFYAIFINLVNNSIKYTQKGTIEFGYYRTSKFFNFYIKDTGIGISKEDQKNIFTRFIQSDISTTRKFEGSGLGLTITKSYIEMLGGQICVNSVLGKGSTFRFTIPY
ncbi:MAG: sensor histidine kinase [Prolixibacteraceae bacterium]